MKGLQIMRGWHDERVARWQLMKGWKVYRKTWCKDSIRQDKCRKKGNVRKEDWMNDSCSTRLRYSRVKRENILIFSIWHSAWKHQQSNYKRFIYNLKYSFYCVQTVPHHIKFVKALATKYENIFIYYLQIWCRIPT